MHNESINIINQLNSIGSIQQSMNQIIETTNESNLFQLSFSKTQRQKSLRTHFRNKKIQKIFVSQRINKLNIELGNTPTEILEDDFFINPDDFQNKLNLIENSIVIVNNNDIHINGQTNYFDKIISDSPKTIFCAWDWDNHHWLSLSCKLAAVVDIYTPCHNENLYQLSKFNTTATNVIPCATVQWSEDYLKTNKERLIKIKRSNDLLGMHIAYNTFKYRVSVIQKISESSHKVGFSTHQFHNLSDDDKLIEWASHKIHFIVPVLNDVPIRLFDAWNTGGIPLVPTSLKGTLSSLNIHEHDIGFYSAEDILDIKPLTNKYLQYFDDENETGIKRRLKVGLNHHHGNSRLKKILEICEDEYQLIL